MFGLATFAIETPFGTVERLGAVVGGTRVVDLRSAYAAHLALTEGDPQAAAIASVRIPDTLLAFIQGGRPCLAAARSAVAFAAGAERATVGGDTLRLVFPLAEVRLRVPLRPGKMVCAGRNYLKHQAESEMPAPDDFPRGFVKVNSTLVAHGDDIPYPKATSKLDYEVELAAVIGTGGRDIPAERAYDHVWGYTIFNDISARDWQFEERKKGNHLLGKNLDATGPLGPWVVPAEFVADPMKLDIRLRVNGDLRQHSNTSMMMYDIARLIAHWSKMTLEPGDLISTGTPEGVASGKKSDGPSLFLKAGDLVEAEVEGIGVLANRIVE